MLSNTTAYHEKTHENVPESLVAALESAFGKVFPEDYRKFLMIYGCVEGDIQILGVPKHGSESAVDATKEKMTQHALDDILVVRQDDFLFAICFAGLREQGTHDGRASGAG